MNSNSAARTGRHPYFQFPLSLLTREKSHRERVVAIFSYGIVTAGLKKYQLLGEDWAYEFTQQQYVCGRLERTYRVDRVEHQIVACGADVTKCCVHQPQLVYDIHQHHESLRRRFVAKYGPEPLVRLRQDLVLEALEGGGIAPEELFVLAGLYSIIGSNQNPVLITQNRIRCRALGYKSLEVMQKAFPEREDGAKPMSEWRLRSMLDRLLARKLFVRVTYGRRQSYYSHRMTEKKLQEAVTELKLKRSARAAFLWARHRQDEAMTAMIRKRREEQGGQLQLSASGPSVVPG